MIGFTFGGLFKEFESAINATSDVRYFQRQLILVPAGDGFCIRNEMTGRSQSSSFLKSQQPMPPVDAFATPTATIEIIGVQMAPDQPDDAAKLQMVQMMSAQSHRGQQLELQRRPIYIR
ncbi:hypothetical protein GQX74_014008 [Glossina fuscipes]|nr:hypothetical protein GQX74_014008 [Glossina fuscipes]